MSEGQLYGPKVVSSFSWVLKEYRRLPSRVGEFVRSPWFTPRAASSLQFAVRLYPRGQSASGKDFVAVYLCVVDSENKQICLNFSVALLKSVGGLIEYFNTGPHICALPVVYGWHRFVHRNKLSRLPADTLIISVDIDVSEPLLDVDDERNVNMADYLAENSAAVDDLLTAWEKGLHSDVAFSVDGTEVPAHRFVLAARSEVFAAMFEHDTLEKATSKIDVTDFDVGTVRAMLRFSYSGKLDNMDVSLALELLRAADKYCMGSLKSSCSDFLVSNMDRDNACEILVAAEVLDAVDLKREAVDYISEELRPEDFDEHKSLLEEHPDLLSAIARRVLELKE